MQRVHFQVRVSVFNCQQFLAKIYFVIFDIVISRMWFSVELVKFNWFGINWHCFNQSECRNCCLCFIIRKIAPQAKSGKYFQIWFFPRFGGEKWRRSEHAHANYDSSFARPGSVPIWGGKKGEFRDWTTDRIEIHQSQPLVSPVPELSFLSAPYRGWTRAGERRVQDNLHAACSERRHFSPQIGGKTIFGSIFQTWLVARFSEW